MITALEYESDPDFLNWHKVFYTWVEKHHPLRYFEARDLRDLRDLLCDGYLRDGFTEHLFSQVQYNKVDSLRDEEYAAQLMSVNIDAVDEKINIHSNGVKFIFETSIEAFSLSTNKISVLEAIISRVTREFQYKLTHMLSSSYKRVQN